MAKLKLTEKEIRLLKIVTRKSATNNRDFYGAARFTQTSILSRSSFTREVVGPILHNLKEKGVIREMVAQSGQSVAGGDHLQINQLHWPDVRAILKADGHPEPSRLCDYVTEFHKTYGCPIADKVGFPSYERRDLRHKLQIEETQEYTDADMENNIVEVADALGDICYVAMGTALEYGIDLDAVIAEIHRSNMSKLGEDGKPIISEDGKVLKGPNYFKPNIAKVLGLQSKED